MEEVKLLSHSAYCRLCCTENINGISLFCKQENAEDVCSLVNKYLPIKVENDDPLPKTICPGCHIQLEATKLFMDLVIDGQAKLRDLLKTQQELFEREEKERLKLERALQNHNPNASVETYTIQTDEDGEKYIIQIYSKGPLFSPEHELALKADGLDKPKRKRGRPPKPAHQGSNEQVCAEQLNLKPEKTEDEEEWGNDVRKRRKTRAPTRYEGVVQGAELDNILKNEGVIDEEVDELETTQLDQKSHLDKADNIEIGKIITSDGQDLGKSVFVNNRVKKHRTKRKTNLSLKTKRKYTCEICNKGFLHQGRYDFHKKSHKIKYACQEKECQVQDEKKINILGHQTETGHNGIALIEQITECNGSLILPGTEPLPSNPIVNPENTYLEKDTQDIQEEKAIKCPKCDKAFSCKQNYEVHLKAIHDGEKPFKCELCGRAFAYACSLKCHMLSHKNKVNDHADPFSCDKCEKVFNHPSSLLYHKDTEHGNQRFICNKCNRTFKHRQLLQRHQLVHTNERPFKCNQCSQAFKTKSNLMNHEIVHSGLKKYVCPTCGQSFGHKTSLSIHLRWHEGSKPYKCDVCNKSFSQKGNLMEHRRIHTGEKPFCCDLCGRNFTTSSQWKLHRKRHTGEKPFTCEYCQKSFLHKETYATHIRRHLNIRPFKCRYCSRAFSENWACSRHEKIHLGEKPYKCDICNRAFADASNFTKHKRTHAQNAAKVQNLVENKEHVQSKGNKITPEVKITDVPIVTTANSNLKIDKATNLEVTTSSLQIQELLDNDGNAISFTTTDGHPIPIVSSDKKIQGLMPDGTLVSFDIVTEQNKEQVVAKNQINLLNTGIQFLGENFVCNTNESLPQEKPAFLTEDGKVCFITSFDENAFLTLT